MKYIFIIEDNSKKARSIINMFYELKDDYDFLTELIKLSFQDGYGIKTILPKALPLG